VLRKNRKVELLAAVPLFSGCSKRELGEIALVADEIFLPGGETLIREGERGREFLVIESGTVRVTRDGRKLTELGAGDWVGEISLVAGTPRTATVTAATPVRVLVISDRAFQSLLRDVPSIATKVLKSLAQRLPADML
jgi:CRP/FNR family transcriptional regulator, cyclic AMP receptor protein